VFERMIDQNFDCQSRLFGYLSLSRQLEALRKCQYSCSEVVKGGCLRPACLHVIKSWGNKITVVDVDVWMAQTGKEMRRLTSWPVGQSNIYVLSCCS